MQKIALLTLSILSLNVYAAEVDLSSTLKDNLNKRNEVARDHSSTLIYGGKDLARPVVVSSNESAHLNEMNGIG